MLGSWLDPMLDKYPLLHNICLYLCSQMRILVLCQKFSHCVVHKHLFHRLKLNHTCEQSDKVAIVSLDLYYSGEQYKEKYLNPI